MAKREVAALYPRGGRLWFGPGAVILIVLLLSDASAGRSPMHPVVQQHCVVASANRIDIRSGPVWFNEDGSGRTGETIFVRAFDIDSHEVTNKQFAAFVSDTGYITQAERDGRSAVFEIGGSVPDLDPRYWWKMVDGASWRRPSGPSSSIISKEDYPVVQVTYADALAYARWAGRDLPTEVQWERAARGRQRGPVEPTRWAFAATGEPIANTWQGIFPLRDTADDGFAGLAPTGCFRGNDFGIYDMVGNAWEWTRSNRGPDTRIIKGGSYLCSRNYCSNFRPAGWQLQEANLATSHIGFRTISRDGA